MSIGDDGAVLAWLEKGELRLLSLKVALQQVEELARDLRTGGSLADELIADRRAEGAEG